MEWESIKNALKDKSEVSVPMLQDIFSTGYVQARDTVNELVLKHIASKELCGVYRKLNVGYFNKRKMAQNEIEFVAADLSRLELSWLERIRVCEEKGYELQALTEKHQGIVERFLKLDLAYEFEGGYFLSITADDMSSIKKLARKNPGCLSLTYIANPILLSCIEFKEDPDELINNPFIPQRCKDYIMNGYKNYQLHGSVPRPVECADGAVDDNSLKFELIESFIENTNYASKVVYNAEAKRFEKKILDSYLCTDYFKNTVIKASEEIVKVMTINNIKELKCITSCLNTGVSDAGDDEC